MKNKSRKGILIAVLLLAIGFASITTTLTIIGVINFGANKKDFEDNLIFTSGTLTYTDSAKQTVEDAKGNDGSLYITDGGRKIEFTAQELTILNEKVTLNYEITNGSQYDGELVEISCTDDSSSANGNAGYITITPSSIAGDIASKNAAGGANVKTGTVQFELTKSFAGLGGDTDADNHKTVTYTCTIVANAKEN